MSITDILSFHPHPPSAPPLVFPISVNGPIFCSFTPYHPMIQHVFFFFFLNGPTGAIWEFPSWGLNWIWAAAMTYTTTVATPDLLTYHAGQGIKLVPPQHPSCCSQILNLLCHSGNFSTCLKYTLNIFTFHLQGYHTGPSHPLHLPFPTLFPYDLFSI